MEGNCRLREGFASGNNCANIAEPLGVFNVGACRARPGNAGPRTEIISRRVS